MKTISGTKRKFSFSPGKSKKNELRWPVNPVDSLNFFILRQLIPSKEVAEFDDDYYDSTEEEREKKWGDIVRKHWLEMGEPIRQLLVTVYNDEVASRFSDADPIPVDTPSSQAHLDTLKWIFALGFRCFREKVSSRIWRDIEPNVREQIFEIYHQQAETFCDAMREDYCSVYSETCSLEYNAKLRLDVFLEVPPRNNDDPGFPGSFTAEACDTFLVRMEGAMNRWNEPVDLAKTDDDVLWDPETITELSSFEPMFGQTFRRGRENSLDFCVPEMVTELENMTFRMTMKFWAVCVAFHCSRISF